MTWGRALPVAVSVVVVVGALALVRLGLRRPPQAGPGGTSATFVPVGAVAGVRETGGLVARTKTTTKVPAFQAQAPGAPPTFTEAEAREPLAAGNTMRALQAEVQSLSLDKCIGQAHSEVVKTVFRYNVRSSSDEISFGLPEMVVVPGTLSKEELSCIARSFEPFKGGPRSVRRGAAAFLDFEGVVEVPAEYGIAR